MTSGKEKKNFFRTTLIYYIYKQNCIFRVESKLKTSSLNFTELFHEPRIQAILEQSVAQFSKLLADHAERFTIGITLRSSVIFNVNVVVKGFNNYYKKNS